MKLIVVGIIKEKALTLLIDEYRKRLQIFTKLVIIEVKEESGSVKNSQSQNEQIKIKEGEAILGKIKEQEYVILLDLHGESIASETFAQKLAEIQTYKNSQIVFIIGGSLGVSQDVEARANWRWKLSDLTFPHQLIRLFAIEQIYRSYMIRSNRNYHK